MHAIDTYISEISNKINIPRFSVFKNDEHWNKQLWFLMIDKKSSYWAKIHSFAVNRNYNKGKPRNFSVFVSSSLVSSFTWESSL